MMDYASMLQGRPFAPPANPYLDLFETFMKKAEAFKRQGAGISGQGTMSRPQDEQRQSYADEQGGEYRAQAQPQSQMFGGL